MIDNSRIAYTSQDNRFYLYKYFCDAKENERIVVHVTNNKAPKQLKLVLQIIAPIAEEIFSGMLVRVEYPFDPHFKLFYPNLPGSGYRVETYMNNNMKKQRLYAVWGDDKQREIVGESIKVYMPDDESQLPFILEVT